MSCMPSCQPSSGQCRLHPLGPSAPHFPPPLPPPSSPLLPPRPTRNPHHSPTPGPAPGQCHHHWCWAAVSPLTLMLLLLRVPPLRACCCLAPTPGGPWGLPSLQHTARAGAVMYSSRKKLYIFLSMSATRQSSGQQQRRTAPHCRGRGGEGDRRTAANVHDTVQATMMVSGQEYTRVHSAASEHIPNTPSTTPAQQTPQDQDTHDSMHKPMSTPRLPSFCTRRHPP
jgi:hypothetical protein